MTQPPAAFNNSDPPLEIERKFLLRNLPENLDLQSGKQIRQGYLCETGERSVRLRQADSQYFLTCKAGVGLERFEAETTITTKQFEQLWPMTAGYRLSKTRYTLTLQRKTKQTDSTPSDSWVAEIDVFHETLQPLMLVEVEFSSLDEANKFQPPEWFGPEVTTDKPFLNTSLARHGLPKDWQSRLIPDNQ